MVGGKGANMRISFDFKEGSTGKDIAAHLRFQAGLIEGLEPKAASSRANTEAEAIADAEETPAPKAKRGRPAKAAAPAASFEEDEETEAAETEAVETEESFEDEESFEETPAPKKKAAAKITIDMVNDTCKAFAREHGGGKEGRDAVLKILKKNFKVTSISELDVEDYPKVLKALAV